MRFFERKSLNQETEGKQQGFGVGICEEDLIYAEKKATSELWLEHICDPIS